MNIWREYNRNDDELMDFLLTATNNDNKAIKIRLDDYTIYECRLVTSKCFSGLSYYKAIQENSNVTENIAVGDDRIKKWSKLNDLLDAA